MCIFFNTMPHLIFPAKTNIIAITANDQKAAKKDSSSSLRTSNKMQFYFWMKDYSLD